MLSFYHVAFAGMLASGSGLQLNLYVPDRYLLIFASQLKRYGEGMHGAGHLVYQYTVK